MRKIAIAILTAVFVLFPSLISAAGISVIDGHKITDKKELHAKLAKDLSFPTYYGNNLDALYDVLVSEKESMVIKIINPYALQRKLGKKYIEGFFAAISDASDENPRVVLILSSK